MGSDCRECAHVMALQVLQQDGQPWRLAPAPWLLDDGQPFGSVSGLIESNPKRAAFCLAPQLKGLLSAGDDSVNCNAARAFDLACGSDAKWFLRRDGVSFSYQAPARNSGQFAVAHSEQRPLHETGFQTGG